MIQRKLIVKELLKRDCTLAELGVLINAQSRQATHHHIKKLVDCGMVKYKDGKYTMSSLTKVIISLGTEYLL